MGNMLMQAKVVEEHAQTKEDHLATEIKSLLVSGTSLSVARKRLQVYFSLLARTSYPCFIVLCIPYHAKSISFVIS